jgi:hypothetical protein
LEIIQNFTTTYPGEILIVEIDNDIQDGVPSYPVPDQAIENLVLSKIQSTSILGRSFLSKPISQYGGIYFAGF